MDQRRTVTIAGGGIAGIVLATVLLRLAFGIDMTGMFPVEPPHAPTGIVKQPRPVDKQKLVPDHVAKRSSEPIGTAVDPAPDEVGQHDGPTPSGTAKKKKK